MLAKEINSKSGIGDYGFIGDCQSAALVSRKGSIDWLCLPRFDSPACFAALLGTQENGRWAIVPKEENGLVTQSRSYLKDTLVLQTDYRFASGSAHVIDSMPERANFPEVVRVVQGVNGSSAFHMEFAIRFEYGSVLPWTKRVSERAIMLGAGPCRVLLRSTVPLKCDDDQVSCDIAVREGEVVTFVMTWLSQSDSSFQEIDPMAAIERTVSVWQQWAGKSSYQGPHAETVRRSLITLKGLIYAPSGGMVAAPTTSLPENIGGSRNWDYRYCWLRDTTVVLHALLGAGYHVEAGAWQEWLQQVVAGHPSQVQILYGIGGERTISERELSFLKGYRDSKPVRVGNAAHGQRQLDVFGELMDVFYDARVHGLKTEPSLWTLQKELLDFLKGIWKEPDAGIWEVRGPMRHFTHSKAMAWLAFSRGVETAKRFGLEGPAKEWEAEAKKIHSAICDRAFNHRLNSFTQSFDSKDLDASLLLLPVIGFLPAEDPRIRGTIKAIEAQLADGAFVKRYDTKTKVDGIKDPREAAFLPACFWLVDALAMLGEREKAESHFEALINVRNDLGLLSEEYNVETNSLCGNFPQAFSHVALVNSAFKLYGSGEKTGLNCFPPLRAGSTFRRQSA